MNDEVIDRGDEIIETPVVPEVEEVVEEEVTKLEKEDDKKGWIPKARFDEAVRKEREKTEAERARVREYESKQQVQTVAEDITQAQTWMKEMVRKRNNLLADGELEKASEIDDKILEVQDAIADRRAEMRATTAKESARSEVQYDAVVAKMEEMYPQINPDSDDYDEDAVLEVRALMSGYQRELKMTQAKALERAAKRVFGEIDKRSEVAVTDAGLRRKGEAVQRNLKAASQQPPKMDAGLDHDKKGGGLDTKTVMKMDYKEFNKLSEDVLAKLRGDEL